MTKWKSTTRTIDLNMVFLDQWISTSVHQVSVLTATVFIVINFVLKDLAEFVEFRSSQCSKAS